MARKTAETAQAQARVLKERTCRKCGKVLSSPHGVKIHMAREH